MNSSRPPTLPRRPGPPPQGPAQARVPQDSQPALPVPSILHPTRRARPAAPGSSAADLLLLRPPSALSVLGKSHADHVRTPGAGRPAPCSSASGQTRLAQAQSAWCVSACAVAFQLPVSSVQPRAPSTLPLAASFSSLRSPREGRSSERPPEAQADSSALASRLSTTCGATAGAMSSWCICVYVCGCLCTCVCGCMYVCVCMWMYECMHVACVCMYVCGVCACGCMSVCVCSMYVSMCMCVHVYVGVCMCVHVYG